MDLLPLIIKKRDGKALGVEEIDAFIKSLISKKPPPDYQISALLAFIVARGLSDDEISSLTQSMRDSGKPFKYPGFPKDAFFLDKHSTGGLGDKLTLPLVPLVLACDERIYYPTIAGRGLGHTGGTIDKLEAIPGFKTSQPPEKFRRIMKKHRGCILSQTPAIAPADRILYALRDVTGTVSSRGLITASILSKKLSETLNFLLIDLKTGTGAFLPDENETRSLGNQMLKVTKSCDVGCEIVMTNMDTPLGHYSGNLLEVRESIEILQNRGPYSSTELTLILAEKLLKGAGWKEPDARRALESALESGRALQKFYEICEAQGAKLSQLEKLLQKPKAKFHSWKAPHSGFIQFDVTEMGWGLVELGAGRKTKADKIDPEVGYFHPLPHGTHIEEGEEVLRIYYRDERKLKACLKRLESGIHLVPKPLSIRPMIVDVLK